MSKKILVPTDFTNVGDTAISHAIKIATTIGSEVHVMHVVGKKEAAADAKIKLQFLKERVKEEKGFDIETILRIGTIFEDIVDYSVEIDATLIVMGTHGKRAMQFLSGTRALKIVTDSKVPFIIVQEKDIDENGYDRIVVPFDLHKNTKQKLKVASSMAKYFNSKVYVVSPSEKDEFLSKQLTQNLNYAKKYFTDRDINIEIKILATKNSGFVAELIDFSQEVEADLISIMNFHEGSLMSFFGGSYEEKVITNKHHIPVLCLNPMDLFKSSGGVFST